MAANFLEKYRQDHQHPVNRALHTVGIPTIVLSLGVIFFNWKLAAAMFVGGWILQFIGHAFEGNKPSFFGNPIFLLIGPVWWALKLVGLDKKLKLKSPAESQAS